MSQLSITIASGRITTSRFHKILKASEDFGFVLAAILVPDEVDLQGDVCLAEDIERAAHAFMETSQRAGYNHQQILKDIVLVESSILRSDTTISGVVLKAGTWIGAWKIYNQGMRDLIKSGKVTGVSIGGTGTRIPLEA